MTVLVTTARGQVGAATARAAAHLALPLRLGARATDADARTVALDFEQPATWAPALAGCTSVLLVRPPAIADMRRTLCPFIDAARAAGVRHLVFVSVAGAERSHWVPHWKVEERLRAGPPDWTILRPGFFAQNLATAYRQDVVQDGRIYVPAGRGQVAFIDVGDIGAVAAAVLAAPAAFAGRVLTLTGPRAVGFDVLARCVAAALGRPVRYVPASLAGYLWHLRRRRGLPWMQALVQTVLHAGLRRGDADHVTGDVAEVLGRAATPVEDSVARMVAGWQPAPA